MGIKLPIEEIKVKAGIYWLAKYGGKFLGGIDLEDLPAFGKEIADAAMVHLMEYLDEWCPKHLGIRRKHECSHCWREIRAELGM